MDMLERHRCYDFRNGDNYTKGDFYIEEKPYYQEFQMGILYFCDNGKDLVVIDYKGPLGMDVDDSPVDGILDSFVFVEENRCICWWVLYVWVNLGFFDGVFCWFDRVFIIVFLDI